VGFSVVGDMSSRPNWGLNELDFVFSTLVVREGRALRVRVCVCVCVCVFKVAKAEPRLALILHLQKGRLQVMELGWGGEVGV